MSTNSQESGSLSLADAMNELSSLPEEGQQEGDAQEVQAEESAEDQAEPEEQSEDEVEESDDEQSEPEEPEQPPKAIRITVEGEEIEVTPEEIQSSYMRQKDYTKKTQQLAEQRKQFEQEAATLSQERAQYAQVLGQLQAQLQGQLGQEPDWDALRNADPIEYSIQWTEWQRKSMRLQAAQQEQARVSQLQQQERQQQLQQHMERERQALELALPQWKDSEKAKAEKALIMEQGKRLGFTDQELAQAYDHRAILALHKAALYDQMMSKAKAAKPAPQRTVEPGRAVKETSHRKRAAENFKSTGSVKDAARLLSSLL